MAWAVKGRMGGRWSIWALQTPQEISIPPAHPYPRTPPPAVPLCSDLRVRTLTYFQNVRVKDSPIMLPASAPVLKEHSPTFLQKAPVAPVCVCCGSGQGSGERSSKWPKEPTQRRACLGNWLKTLNPVEDICHTSFWSTGCIKDLTNLNGLEITYSTLIARKRVLKLMVLQHSNYKPKVEKGGKQWESELEKSS